MNEALDFDAWEGKILSDEELEKALRGICPLCSVGLVIGYKLKEETDTWKLKCDRCHFVTYHNMGL